MDSLIDLTEFIQAYDPISQHFREAIQRKTFGLKKKNKPKIISKTNLAANSNILGARFVLTIKIEGTPQGI